MKPEYKPALLKRALYPEEEGLRRNPKVKLIFFDTVCPAMGYDGGGHH